MEQVDASLTRLGTNYVDLYQIHRFDSATPVAETMEALQSAPRSSARPSRITCPKPSPRSSLN